MVSWGDYMLDGLRSSHRCGLAGVVGQSEQQTNRVREAALILGGRITSRQEASSASMPSLSGHPFLPYVPATWSLKPRGNFSQHSPS